MTKDASSMSEAEARAFARGAARTKPDEAVRDRVIAAVLNAGVTFWRDRRHEALATIPLDGHMERCTVRSKTFKNVVRLTYGDANPVALDKNDGGRTRPAAIPDQAPLGGTWRLRGHGPAWSGARCRPSRLARPRSRRVARPRPPRLGTRPNFSGRLASG